MIVWAKSIGCRVPTGEFQAVIHSVFESAVNLYVRGLEYLVTILASNDMDLPQGIRVPTEAHSMFAQFKPAQPAALEGTVLRFPASGTEIYLEKAVIYSSRVRALDCTPANKGPQAARETARLALIQRQVEAGTDIRVQNLSADEKPSLLRKRSALGLVRMVHAARERDISAAVDACEMLIGLGMGLTPGGDDVLVGVLAGLWATCRDDKDRLQWVKDLGGIVISRSSATNIISRTYLHMAAVGEFSSSLSALAGAVCEGASADLVLQASELVFETGSTSGMDAATGLLTGLAAWD